jgi:anti-sigma factor RsiW
MNHLSEERLALHAGSDLAWDQTGAVEEHLRNCAECRASLAQFRNDRAVLLDSLREPAADELLDVRRRVLQRLEGQRPPRRDWIWGTAAVAAIVVAMMLFPSHSSRRKITADPATASYLRVPYHQVVQPSLPNIPADVDSRRASRHRLEPGLRSVALLSQRDGPPILKMTTSDPEVVILWQLTERTRGNE